MAEKVRRGLVFVLGDVPHRGAHLAPEHVLGDAHPLVLVGVALAFQDGAMANEERAIHHQREEAEDHEREDDLEQREAGGRHRRGRGAVRAPAHVVARGARRSVRIV